MFNPNDLVLYTRPKEVVTARIVDVVNGDASLMITMNGFQEYSWLGTGALLKCPRLDELLYG